MSTWYIKYCFSIDYKREVWYSANVYVERKKKDFEELHSEDFFIVPLGDVPQDLILDKEKRFEMYVKKQLDDSHKGIIDALQRLAIPGSMVTNSRFEFLQWQGLSDDEQIKFLEGSYKHHYDRVQRIIEKAVNIFESKKQLDRGEPAPPLTSQTPAPETAPESAAQPPAVDAEQTAQPNQTQTPGASMQAASNRTKGGRPSQVEIDNICFAIIEMFLSYQKDKTLNDIKELDDAVEKINRRLSDKKCGIKIDVRRLDGDKIPGQLFRYLWRNTVGVFEWGYTQDKMERDKKMADKYMEKYKIYKGSLK